jgi:type II secretory pathway component PulF
MRMAACPHCGAQNSIKRATCYQCEQPLTPEQTTAPESTERPQAASRWEAIGTETGRAPVPPMTSTSPSSVQAPAEWRPRRFVPARRQALRHVREMGIFFRQLHAQTKAGITLTAACRELERSAPARMRPMAGAMTAATDAGSPISEVLDHYATFFYPWHLGIIRAAESAGFLPEAFDQIAQAYETEWETRAALRLQTFFYTTFGLPAVLIALPLILTVAQPIPEEGWTPQTLIATIIHLFQTISLPIAAGLLVLLLVWQGLQSTAWFQAVQQKVVLRLPLVGRVARAAALDRYMGTLGLMLRGGLPIARAAEEAAYAAGNAELTPKLLDFVPQLREGVPLARLLAESRLFDTDTLNMAATGETTGALPDMLTRAAGYYRADTESRRKILLQVAKVAFFLLWAGIAGGLFFLGLRTYFDFAFRTYDWMMEGFE